MSHPAEQASTTSAGTQDSLFPVWIHDGASLASILSLAVSLFVAWKLRSISKHYQQLALVPLMRSRAATSLKNLQALNDSKDWPGFRKESAVVRVLTGEAKVMTYGTARNAANDAHEAARQVIDASATEFSPRSAETLILRLTELEYQLKYFIEQKKWQ